MYPPPPRWPFRAIFYFRRARTHWPASPPRPLRATFGVRLAGCFFGPRAGEPGPYTGGRGLVVGADVLIGPLMESPPRAAGDSGPYTVVYGSTNGPPASPQGGPVWPPVRPPCHSEAHLHPPCHSSVHLPPVILRRETPKNLFGKILRCAQDDKRGTQDDKRGAQDDKMGGSG